LVRQVDRPLRLGYVVAMQFQVAATQSKLLLKWYRQKSTVSFDLSDQSIFPNVE